MLEWTRGFWSGVMLLSGIEIIVAGVIWVGMS